MNRSGRSLAIVLLLLAACGPAWAASNVNHQVTVTVTAINEITLAGGNITLTINSATGGSEPDPATNATCSIAWTTTETGRKITAQTSLATPEYELEVEATGVTGGTTAGAVVLTTTGQDFVTGVAETTGGATLSYTATATASDGTGTEVNTVTYTVTAA